MIALPRESDRLTPTPLTILTIPKPSKFEGIMLTNNRKIRSKDKDKTNVAAQTVGE
jgi:hypothetical protein